MRAVRWVWRMKEVEVGLESKGRYEVWGGGEGRQVNAVGEYIGR
jgi:hypothetical protein